MDQSLDQFIKDRKIKFPGRGRGFSGSRGSNRGQFQFRQQSRGRGGRGFQKQTRGRVQNVQNFRGFNRGGFYNRNQRNFNNGYSNRGFVARGRSGFRNNFQRSPRSFPGVARGGVVKRFAPSQRSFTNQFQSNISRPATVNALTKLYISNLDFGVSNQDIKELFSDFGPIRRFGVNFNSSGHSLGTAEVHYLNKQSAIKAIQKYNNVPLDGRPMKLEVAGATAAPIVKSAPATTPFNRLGAAKKVQQKYQALRGRGAGRGRVLNRGAARVAGARGRGFNKTLRGGVARKSVRGKKFAPPTQDQLDADLDSYLAKV